MSIRATATLALLFWQGFLVREADADVCVVANRAAAEVEVQVSPRGGRPYNVSIAAGDVKTLYSDGGLGVAFVAGGEVVSYQLAANSAAFFGRDANGNLGLQRIGLGGDETTSAGRPLPGDAQPAAGRVIDVKLMVDDDEPHRQAVWERRLRDRVAAASRVLRRHTGIGLRVVSVGIWQSDNQTTDFTKSLLEFESEVSSAPGKIAIGFTSQYEAKRGRIHLGGTRGPLRQHILLREWSGVVSERERLELLIHELGHFFGATHSPEQNSVMRPILGDRQARRKAFTVRFDPVNALIMAMVAEEVRRRGITSFTEMSNGTRSRMAQIYGVMQSAMPEDPSSQRFVQLTNLRGRSERPDAPSKRVLRAIVYAAAINAARPEAERVKDDALTELYVCAAATEAAKLPAEAGPAAMLEALGVALDDTNTLRNFPITSPLARTAETAQQRSARLKVIGKPTIQGRPDLAKHFFVSALLASKSDAETADQLGIAKETLDAQRASGFSFVDLAANRAGIRFAEALGSGRLKLARFKEEFRLSLYVPDLDGLPEGLTSSEVIEKYGGVGDERFDKVLAEIDKRIDGLLPYLVLPIKPLGR
ncbi:MAG: M12 family metallo-peptidase [Planctomycetota bacterium]